VQNPLGLSCGAARIKNEERLFGGEGLRNVLGGCAVDGFVPPQVATLVPLNVVVSASNHENVGDRCLTTVGREGLVNNRLEGEYVALAVPPVGRNHELGAGIVDATDADWTTEYLAPILSIAIVPGADDAIRHINTYGSKHTDAIVTENWSTAMRFLREVDSASVMVNASTRFADGFEYGLGAEIGISNDKLHARGPVGLEGLTSLKYVVFGNGEVRT
jgi:hypothetical protein